MQFKKQEVIFDTVVNSFELKFDNKVQHVGTKPLYYITANFWTGNTGHSVCVHMFYVLTSVWTLYTPYLDLHLLVLKGKRAKEYLDLKHVLFIS